MGNPFYFQEVPVDAPFCDREDELRELQSYAEAKANVVLYSPRRYGKTSLAKRVQKHVADRGAITIFADLFGVASTEDAAARLAKAIFSVTHSKEPLWQTALRVIQSFRPVLKPEADGSVTLSVEPSSASKSGMALLHDTMESLGTFIKETKKLVHITLDEFQEIVTLKESLHIEAAMRTSIQQQQAAFFFVGSRRRVLLGIFNERQRPFFQSAINYQLSRLPADALAEFIARQFFAGKKKCSQAAARKLLASTGCHPYYSQKLAFFVYECPGAVTEQTVADGMDKLMQSDRPVFEAILQGLSLHQKLLLQVLAKDPTPKMLAGDYIRKHRLGSIGGVQHSSRQLEDLDLIEKNATTGCWELVDPILSLWLKRQMEAKV